MGLFEFAEATIGWRTALDLFERDIEADLAIGPVQTPYRLHGDQHALAQP
jgi:hypothetical protein